MNILYNCWFLHTTGRLFFVSMGLNERGRTSDHCVTAELKNWILLDLYIYISINLHGVMVFSNNTVIDFLQVATY